MPRPRYTITTPIYYATDEPHIGHAYCTVAADVAARYRRLTGHDVFLLTGTDEHGQKMERAAARQGLEPRDLADATTPRYLELWRQLNISHDRFVRTTEPRHRDAVYEMWRRMEARGDVYKSAYQGKYCVDCESFKLDKELVDGKCPLHGTVPELLEEEGYFFRLSSYQQPLLDHYRAHPDFVQPESRRNEVVSFVEAGLKDLSISRTTTRWGLPVPGDPTRIIYVWVDALTNYLTGVGFPGDAATLQRWWPADVHLVGKDITRFHAVYWPALLLSAGIELPGQVFGHGFWLRDNQKISKSRGGAIRLQPLIEGFGADAVRYFLLREIPFGLDGTYSDEAFAGRYNSDLANDFGNLASRTLQMLQRFAAGMVPDGAAGAPEKLRVLAGSAVASYRASFDALAFSRGLDAVWELVRAGNRHVDEGAPWVLARDPSRRADLDAVLYAAAELVRLVAACLSPVMPEKTVALQRSLGLGEGGFGLADLSWGVLRPGTRIAAFEPLFPRVDVKQWLEGGAAPAASAPGPQKGRPMESKPGDATAETATPGAGGAAAKPPGEAGATAVAGSGPGLAAGLAPPAPALLSIDEFFRTDLRVARIKHAERVPSSKKLIKLIVDLGREERQVVAGIADKYAPEALVGKCVIVVANLKPAKLMGVESQGMVLAASASGVPILATFEEEVPPGTQVK